jgi:hypothetical protein
MTRTESHLIFSGGEKPNTFLQELPVDIEGYAPSFQDRDHRETTQTQLGLSVPTPDGPISHSPHSLMRDDVFENVNGGRGTEFGTQVHEFAERYALGEPIEPSDEDDKHHVKEFIDSLDGELHIEEDVYLPLTVAGKQVTIAGVVDLVHILPETVEIVDYKTDRGRHAQSEYRKQVSVYYHVVRQRYPDREIATSVFYTEDGAQVPIDPLSIDELIELTEGEMDSASSASAT